ncbi:hypothetical protein C1Y40_04476 [Mycobacterium talmoniae]|uniref:Luciferase-like domain-containing protein n=1 Tax=Mycobacterium talmoniae TaxID=1858794 RepID=A0A1S1NL08_9MYCO|nr:hypothetical protein BKN37_06575 [Mycobacterium talmoniae]PQM45359.1 hypothetical protein C1Y40_04476 [Mycobacterium talmoniae]
MSERFDLKEAGALLGGVLARTSRLEAGTGIAAAGARSPLMAAAMAATLQAAYGHRFIFGLGRSSGPYLAGQGIREMGLRGFEDYFDLLRRLFRGEEVTYQGPAGNYQGMRTVDPKAFRILYYMITANDLDEEYTRAIAHARLVTYSVGMPAFAQAYITNNGWDAT